MSRGIIPRQARNRAGCRHCITKLRSDEPQGECPDRWREIAYRQADMLGLLLGRGLRRSEVATLEIEKIQRQDGRWAIVDLVGKAGRVRAVPVPLWVKTAIDNWSSSAGIGEGRLFRAIQRNSALWCHGVTQNIVWYLVKNCSKRAGIEKLSSHDLRRSCARMCPTAQQKSLC